MDKDKGAKIPICKVCDRLHSEDMMCPRRIANAYTMQGGTQAIAALTMPDVTWMKTHPDFHVLDVVEDAIADLD